MTGHANGPSKLASDELLDMRYVLVDLIRSSWLRYGLEVADLGQDDNGETYSLIVHSAEKGIDYEVAISRIDPTGKDRNLPRNGPEMAGS